MDTVELALAVLLLELEPPLLWLALEVAAEFKLLVDVELAEKGLVPPEPQPTIEATVMAAAPNFIKTLGSKPTL